MAELKYQGRCPRCLDTGMCLGYNKTMVVIMVFCGCGRGQKLRLKSQRNPLICPLCHGRGEIEIGPEKIQCPHVSKRTYALLPPAQLPKPDVGRSQDDKYACVER